MRDAYFVPSAPDTSRFVATVSGMVEIESNVHWHGSHGTHRTYGRFLKVGGGIPTAKRDAAYARFRKELAERTGRSIGESEASIECADGIVHLAFNYGTSWGGIGVRIIGRART